MVVLVGVLSELFFEAFDLLVHGLHLDLVGEVGHQLVLHLFLLLLVLVYHFVVGVVQITNSFVLFVD